MNYPENFEQKAGFDKVRALLCKKCLSTMGEERVSEMTFSTSFDFISKQLEQTNEFVQIINGEMDFPTSYFFDLRPALKRIRPEGTFLDEKEMFDLKRSLTTVSEIVRFLLGKNNNNDSEDVLACPALAELANALPLFPGIMMEIDKIIDKAGNIKDNASPALMNIRREIVSTTNNIARMLQSTLRAAQSEGIVEQDVTPTLRDGRLMIPVSPAFKRRIRGIVHDESSSGKTVFIEPEAVVEANNKIRELAGEEKREIIRILTAMTDIVRPEAADMMLSYNFLADIDFIRAKAMFAKQLDAIRPTMIDYPYIDWQCAVHPLLFLSHQAQNKETVPLDITLTSEQRILIISGPNAGGKSVCLKTVGLLQYMLQCGMPIPVGDRSQAGIFEAIFIDIGDEQSIENDLSTYSSHLINMKYFDRHANQKTLFLIDEFGSGTEPQIGGAIAEALLQRFNEKNSFGLITTHYQNLKHIAGQTPGLVNGAMLYDRHLMKPLFKLAVGHPGSSFAIEIARKIGLPSEVINSAAEKVGADYVNMDKYLSDITRDKRYWETKRENIKRQEKKITDLADKYETDLDSLAQQRKELIRQAKDEARQLLSQTNAKIESVIREIKEAQADKEQTKLARKALDDFKSSIEKAEENDAKINRMIERIKQKQIRKNNKQLLKTEPNKETLAPGDTVRIKGQTAPATILSIQGNEAQITLGSMKSFVKLNKLEKISNNQIKKLEKNTFVSPQTSENIREKKLNFKQELDIRGMRADEAQLAVSYFIDDAIMVGISPVRILHGTGSGVLRQIVRDYLRITSGISSFRDEHVQFGGTGITVVELG
ncbi:MAG: endonuclease MutS2 [Tannerellaceae bacterium]|nr:endonuclease MutS2 [Tannerellaceae bacterium]